MKLQRLSIHNIASIAEAEIDFASAPLSDSGVFLISGNTGAGKSTILDCICLALFCDIPRLAHSNMKGDLIDVDNSVYKVNEVRQMLRRGAGEGSVSLVFIGSDGVRYRAEWSVRRARKKIDGSLQNRLWAIFDDESGKLLSDKRDGIREIIKRSIDLDFEQFCRTTMLAQGDFNRFIDSDDDDKSAILEKILGNTIYSKVGARIYQVTSEKLREAERCSAALDEIKLLSDEELREIDEECNRLNNCSKQIAAEIAIWNGRSLWLSQYRELLDERDKVHTLLVTHREKIESDGFKMTRRFIADWNEAEQLRLLTVSRDGNVARLKQDRMRLKCLRDDYAILLRQRDDLKKEQHKLCEAGNELFCAEKLVCKTEGIPSPPSVEGKRIIDVEGEWLDMFEAKVAAREKDNPQAQLAEITARSGLVGQLIQIAKDLSEARERRKADYDAIQQLKDELKDAEETLKRAEADEKSSEMAAAIARQLYDRQKAAIDDWAREMRRTLHEGDHCPVCNALIDSAFPPEEEFDEIVRPLADNARLTEDDLKSKQHRRLSAAARVKGVGDTLVRAEKRFAADKSVEKLAARELEISGKCEFVNDYPSLQVALEELQQESVRLQQICASLSDARGELNALKSDYAARRKRLMLTEKKLNEVGKEHEAVEKSICSIKRMLPDWNEIVPKSSNKTVNHLELLTSLSAVNASIEVIGRQIEDDEDAISRERQSHPDWDETYVESLLKTSKEAVSAKQQYVTDTLTEFARAEENMSNVNLRLDGHRAKRPEMDDDLTVDKCAEKLASLAVEKEKCDTGLGRVYGILDQDKQNRTKAGRMRVTLEEARREYERWEGLNTALGCATGKKFRRVALSYVLDSLVQGANSFMRMLMPRYELTVRPGTYTIYVIDSYSDYTERPVTGISGGETFIVSLALALSLAEIGGAVSPDILFIDEGFGSLSGEHLNSAIETLRQLNLRAGRRVGIISHVEELRERIPVQIQVRQSVGSAASEVTVVGK